MALHHYHSTDIALHEPNPLYLRYQQIQAESACAPHSHPWGQLSLISLGVMEIVLDQHRLVAPADYLIWVPADLEHASYNQQALDYTSIYVNHALAARLPAEPCLLEMTPLIRAMLADFCERKLGHMQDEWDVRQAELLVEKLTRTRCQDSYLPMSQDKLLAPMLAALRAGTWHEFRPVAGPAQAAQGAGLAQGGIASAGNWLAARLRLHLGLYRHVQP